MSEQFPAVTVEVGMFEWACVQAPDKTRTTPLRPCIGVATYDPKTATGITAHFVVPHTGDEIYALRDIRNHLETMSDERNNARAWVRGGYGPESDYTRTRRDRVIDMLVSAGIPLANTDIQCSTIGDSVIMELDYSTGEFTCYDE